MRLIYAIDPGTTHSGFVSYDAEARKVIACGDKPNDEISVSLRQLSALSGSVSVACEMIASYGMAVGQETFDTCVWIGEFRGVCKMAGLPWQYVYRKEVKLFLCGTHRAKDANIRQAILDLFGGKEKAIGNKKHPGPLYEVKSHAWSALAVALVAAGNAQ